MDIHKYERGGRRSLAQSIYQILSRREFVTPEDKTELKKKICHLRSVKEAIIYNLKMKHLMELQNASTWFLGQNQAWLSIEQKR